MGIQVANLAGMFEEGRTAGREDKKRGALAKFLQPARAGDKDAQTALYGAGAGTEAAGAQDYAQKQQGDAREQFGKASVMLTNLGNGPQAQQAYSQWRQHGIAAGVLPGDVPEQFEPGSLQVASAAAQAYGGMKPATPEAYTLAPGSKRFGADNKLVAESPFAPTKATIVNVPDGNGGMQQMEFDGQNYRLPNYGNAPQATGAPSPVQSPQGGVLSNAYNEAMPTPQTFAGIASEFPGVQLTSTKRTPERNAAVGGKPNSQHLRGTAGDFVVPEAQKPSFIAAMAARKPPLQAIDEGDHVHVQYPRGGQGGAPQAGRMGYTPPKSATMTPAQKAAADNAAERLKLAQRAADRADRKPAPDAKLVRETKAQDASFSEIERLVGKLEGSNDVSGWSSTFMPFGEDRNTYQSTTGQLAVLLKPLIRGPGEGTWTDKDQELLERLVPKLDNYEGTNTEVLGNIRSLIASKRLGMGIGAGKYTVGQIITVSGKRYRVTDVSDPNDPDLEEVR